MSFDGEADLEVVALLPRHPAPEHLLVAPDPVVDVDDEIARGEALEDVARHDAPERLGPPDADGPEQLAVGDDDEAVRAAGEPGVEAPRDEGDGAGRRRVGDPHGRPDRDLPRRRGARRGAAPGPTRG